MSGGESQAKTAQQDTVAANPTPSQPSAPSEVDIEVTKDDHIKGGKNAKVTIVEYSDLNAHSVIEYFQHLIK